MQDLIFISMEDWDDIWRRNQFICANLARRHPDIKILFVGIGRNVIRHIASGNLAPLIKNPTWTVTDFPNITVTRPLRLAPETLAVGRKINQKLARNLINKLARQLGMRNPTLWLNP